MNKISFLGSVIVVTIFAAFAGDGWVRDAQILGVSICSTPSLGHNKTGFEISIADNVVWPDGVALGNAHEPTTEFGSSYTKVYRINVNEDVPEYKSLLALVLSAKANGNKVDIYVTDDQTLNTYPGRPSLKAIGAK